MTFLKSVASNYGFSTFYIVYFSYIVSRWNNILRELLTFESHLPKTASCQIKLNLAQILNFMSLMWFWRKTVPLEKELALHLHKLYLRMIYAKFPWIRSHCIGEEDKKIEEFIHKQTDKQADFGQCAIKKPYITWSFSSGELKECWIKQMLYDWLHWFYNVMWSCRNVKLMSLLPLDSRDP